MVFEIEIGNPIKPQKNVPKPDQNVYRCVQESLSIFSLFGQKTNFNYIIPSSHSACLACGSNFFH